MGLYTKKPDVQSKGRSGREAFAGLDAAEKKQLLKDVGKKGEQKIGGDHTISANEDGGYNVTRKKGW